MFITVHNSHCIILHYVFDGALEYRIVLLHLILILHGSYCIFQMSMHRTVSDLILTNAEANTRQICNLVFITKYCDRESFSPLFQK